jgi:hypothetical protein
MSKCIRYSWFILAVLALLLSACQAEIVQPTVSPTIAQPEQALPPVAKPTEIISTASNIPAPSETLSPSATSPLLTPTPDWMTFDLDAWESASPDGLWVARIVAAYPPKGSNADEYHVWLRIDPYSDRSKGWIVVDEWLNIGLGMTTPTVMRWTEDGAALFIADTGVPDGCGPRFFMNVRRFDLQAEQVIPLDEKLFGTLSVSPNGSTLVEFSQNAGLVIHDLTGGGTLEVVFEQPDGDWWPGGIIWSPDGRDFLFDMRINPCGTQEEATSSIWRVELEDHEASLLIQDDAQQLSLKSWPEACLAQTIDFEGSVWWLNPCSGELSQTPPDEVVLALNTLLGFFDSLNQGDFAKAVGYYGGSYEHLQEINQSVDPDDPAALLSNACLVNGYKCLPVLSYVLESWSDDEFRFLVTFDQDGEAFMRGPCCGASAIDQPPDWQFTYTLIRDPAGAFRVLDMPVYVP